MRVIVADDSLLTRTGIVTVLREVGCDVSRRLATPPRPWPPSARTSRTWPSSNQDAPTHTDEGLVAALEIQASAPGTAALVLSQYVEPDYAMRLIQTYPGGMGYLLKERILEGAVLLDAVRRLADGECVIDPTIVAQSMQARRKPDPLAELTGREREVLAQLAEGRVELGDRANPLHHGTNRRGAHDADLPEARPRGVGRRSSPGLGRTRVPPVR